MSHEPNNPPPVAKSPASRRKGVAARLKTPESDPATAFIAAHNQAFHQPSGEAHFDIQVSAKSAHWRYEACTTIGKPFGFDPPNASMRTTDINVRACIPPDWFITTSPWREALARTKCTTSKLAIGAEITEPSAPADAAWIVHVVSHSYQAQGYGGMYQKLLLLSLGQHSVLVPFQLEGKDPGGWLTEHIRMNSIKRLQGPQDSA